MPKLEANIPAQGTAGSTQDWVIGECDSGGTVQEVVIVPEAAVTANATNYRTIRVINKGSAGAGSTVVASYATNVVTTNDLVAFDEKSITLSGTAANLILAADDVLVADETVAGTGVAHGGYTIKVVWKAP